MAVEITAFWTTSSDAPLTSPSNTPTIRIRRLSDNALVVTDAAMTEVGDGLYSYSFDLDTDLDYVARADGDPTAASQVPAARRYLAAGFSGLDEKARIDITNRMDINVAETVATVYKDDKTTVDHTFTLTPSPSTRSPD